MTENKKEHHVGLRMDKSQKETLTRIEEETDLSKTEILLKGLENLKNQHLIEKENSDLGLDERPLNTKLKRLKESMTERAEKLNETRAREKMIKEFVRELRNYDGIVEKYDLEKKFLIQILLEIQDSIGWIPEAAMVWVSEKLEIPMTKIRHIVTFFKIFNLEPGGEHTVRMCMGTSCKARGASLVLDRIEEHLQIRPGETGPDRKFTLETVNCLGCCAMGPVMDVDGDYYGDLDPSKAVEVLDQIEGGA